MVLLNAISLLHPANGQPTNTEAAPSTTASFNEVVVILMENHGLSDIIGSTSAPYMNTLGTTYGLATQYTAVDHPSEPNYVALLGGDTFGIVGDGNCCWKVNQPNLVDRLESAGLTWKAFAEDASGSGTCGFSPPRSSDHFPFMDYKDMNTPARCANMLTTASSADSEFLATLNSQTPPNFTWLTPNDCNNMHDCSIATGDTYLAGLVPRILTSTLFNTQKAALFVVFDEGNGSYPGDYVYSVWAGPAVKKTYSSSTQYSHYSFLRTIETVWNLPTLTSNDAGAADMTGFFGASTPSALVGSFTLAPSAPIRGKAVVFTGTAMGGLGPYSFSWDFGDGNTGSSPTPTHVYALPSVFTVTLTVTDSAVPPATSVVAQILTVSSPAGLTTGFVFSPSGPAVSQQVTFTASPSGGVPPYTVTWDFGDGATGTGVTAMHTYATAQSYGVTESARDSSSPQQTATSSQSITVFTSARGNFGECSPLPQGWNCSNTNGLAGSSISMVNGELQTRESNPGVGGDKSYYYATTQKGTFPWSPCQAPASGVLPQGLASVSTTFTPLNFTRFGNSTNRYHIYLALYYWLPNGPVSSGGSTYQCLDTQVRAENIGGSFSAGGSTATYNPGDSFGWDNVTLGSVTMNQSYTLTASVDDQCRQDLLAWGQPSTTPCQLAGIEIGTEGYQFQELNVNWFSVQLSTLPSPLTTSYTFAPTNPQTGQTVSFSSTASGGTGQYTYSWDFGDGNTGAGVSVTHTYSAAGNFTVALTTRDSASNTATTAQTVSIEAPLIANLAWSPANPLANRTVAFASTAAGGKQPYTYTWSTGDGATNTGAGIGHKYSHPGNYTVKLTVRDSTGRNVSISRTITVSTHRILPGDLNGDCVVDIKDAKIALNSYGKSAGNPGFDARADINHDGVVNILDMAIVAVEFGQKC